MSNYHTIGRPVPLADGSLKVTGQAYYPADVLIPGTLWGKALRSPLPHARIKGIDTSRARRLAGVHAVLTAADLPDRRVGRRLFDMPVLARGKVRFIGERVASVAAEDRDVAEEALTLIDVEYEELPAVYDHLEAMQLGAPILHDNINAYLGLPNPVEEPTNRFIHNTWTKGDVKKGFAEAERIFEHTFNTPRGHQGYLEPHACVVQIDDAGRAQVWVNSKAPFPLRNQTAHVVGLEPDQVCINVSYIGGDFGGKGDSMDVPLAYFLAKASSRPVKMVMTYTEELLAGNPRHPGVITIRSGMKKDGTIVAREARAVFNSGAYGAFKPSPDVNLPGTSHLEGSYRIPHVHIEADIVYTNTIPCGYMRGPGAAQTVFAVECHMDMIAEEWGIDPLELRRRNALQEGDATAAGEMLHKVRGLETLDAAARAIDWDSPKDSPLLGKGISFYDRPTGGRESSATVVVEADGTVNLQSTTFDVGTGAHTIFRQIVAEELTLPLNAINVIITDTDSGPFDYGVAASRITHAAGQATLRATQQLRQQLIGVAAEILRVPGKQIELKEARFFPTGDNSRALSLAEVAAKAAKSGKPASAQVIYMPEGPNEITSFCAQAAEVEVDTESGEVHVRRFVSAHDVGMVLNPLTHRGQIEGGVIQGLGYALMEELKVEEGQVTTTHFGDYKIPNIQDIPKLIVVLLEEPVGPTPYQGKGIGEISNCPVAAAIANAVADAVGVRITDLPITAEKVLAEIKGKEQTL